MFLPRIARFCLPALLLVSLVSNHGAVAQTPAQVPSGTLENPQDAELRKQIQGYYQNMDRAWERLDVNASVQYMPLDYTFIGRKGKKENLSRYKDTWRSVLGRAVATKMNTEIGLFTVKGDTVAVETKKIVEVKMRRDDGIEIYGDANQQARDFWMKRDGKWIMKQSRVYDFSVKINGKLIKE